MMRANGWKNEAIALAITAIVLVIMAPLALAQDITGKPFSALSTASNNATLVYNDRAVGKNLTVINTTATQYFFKLYDKKTAPTCGTDTPVWRIPIPQNTAGGGVVAVSLENMQFFNGIGFCLVANLADSDNTNAATGVAINMTYFPQ